MDTADKNTTQEAFERIIAMLRGIQEDLQAIKNSRRVIDGERILDFSEVCRYAPYGRTTGTAIPGTGQIDRFPTRQSTYVLGVRGPSVSEKLCWLVAGRFDRLIRR